MERAPRRAPGNPESPRTRRQNPRRPPPRAGCNLKREGQGIQRAIMTIGEDQVVSYIDEESQAIERMLQEKRDSAERDVERVTDGLGALAVGGTVADGVDPSLVVSALENLLGSLGSDVGNEIVPKCVVGDDFYTSESGNDALAAGMFDISVVCAELGADTGDEGTRGDSGVESVEPSPSDAAKAGATAPMESGAIATGIPPRNKRVEIVRETIYDQYRPRTSSKAPEPDFGSETGRSMLPVKMDGTYRPRTSSSAPEPDANLVRTDDSYRPRTSSKAPEPDFDTTRERT